MRRSRESLVFARPRVPQLITHAHATTDDHTHPHKANNCERTHTHKGGDRERREQEAITKMDKSSRYLCRPLSLNDTYCDQ